MGLMSKLTAAYLAGFIDGEGYLGLIRYKKKNGRREDFYEAALKVASTDRKIIEWLKNSFGGSISEREMGGNSKKAFCWEVRGKMVVPIIDKIFPYLKIKKPQAELLKRYRKTIEKPSYSFVSRVANNGGRFISKTLKPEIVEYRLSLYSQIKTLNQRGKLLHAERLIETTPRGK